MIIINFKNYVHGDKALNLAKKIEKYLPKAIVAVSAVDIGYIEYYTNLQVYAQHVDFVDMKRRATGFVTKEAIKSHDSSGSLLNHSEHILDFEVIKKTMEDCNKNNLKVILCVRTLKETRRLRIFKPYAMAFEDQELIATGKSITNYRTKDIKKFVEMLRGKNILPVCGAGISSLEDVVAARELGCKGVLIASAIADSKNSEKLLRDLEGIKF